MEGITFDVEGCRKSSPTQRNESFAGDICAMPDRGFCI
jgi:hypothetical protein